MNSEKVGKLIYQLRKEKKLTQKQLADIINVSDKAISKWERGAGCPDITLLTQLSKALNISIDRILDGELDLNKIDSGNINKIRFYVCPNCSNIITATSDTSITCCGRPLNALKAKASDLEHHLNIEEIEDDFYITFSHEMSKSHYINFIAYVTSDRVFLVRLYPEQASGVRFAKIYGGTFYFGCNRDGLWVQKDE